MTSGPEIRDAARATHAAKTVSIKNERLAEMEESAAPTAGRDVKSAGAVQKDAPKDAPRRSGFFPVFAGGLVAAGLGFAAAYYLFGLPGDSELPQRVSGVETALTDVNSKLDDLQNAIDALAADIPEVDTQTPAAVEALTGQLDAVAGDVDGLRSVVDSLQDTVANVAIAGGASEDAPDFAAAFDSQMADFRAEVDALRATAQSDAEAFRAKAEAEAAAAAEAAERAEQQLAVRSGLSALQAALETGAPFSDALINLQSLDVPSVLNDAAETGVVSLSELQRSFPDAARAALAVAKRTPDETAGAVGRITSFLLAQTNARSLEPREGNDADAILSRAEAALKTGDLQTLLAEVSALEPAPMDAMSDWLDSATLRAGVVAAAAELNTALDAM